MTIPTEREIRKPLLDILDAAGGELRMREAVAQLGKKLGLADGDLRSRTQTGVPRFQNRVAWARLKLVHTKCLFREPAGLWRLTDLGRRIARGEISIPWSIKGRRRTTQSHARSEAGKRDPEDESSKIEGLGRFINFDPYDAKRLPDAPGVYVFYDISERPIYVGEAQNIAHRIRQHHEKFWFKPPIVKTASYVQIAGVKLRRQIEAILIRFLKRNAVLNKQHVDRS